jgi:hypothetical protein
MFGPARSAFAVIALGAGVLSAAPSAMARGADVHPTNIRAVAKSHPAARKSAVHKASVHGAAVHGAAVHGAAVHKAAVHVAKAPLGPLPTVGAPSGIDAEIADWVKQSGDNDGRPFVIINKTDAEIFVFDSDGALMGAAPALVGLAHGDDSVPGIGDRPLAAVRPSERTTPAGRFVAAFGPATDGKTVLWVDYKDSVSLHPVVTTNPKEHRLERIRSTDPAEHRISYGCINVPAEFYNDVVMKAFDGGKGKAVVYILPDTKPVEEVFPRFARTHSVATRDDAARP